MVSEDSRENDLLDEMIDGSSVHTGIYVIKDLGDWV